MAKIKVIKKNDEYEEVAENTDLSPEEYEQAANYWKKKDEQSVKIEREALVQAAEAYIKANNTCALATAVGDFVRCTPVEYVYYKNAFWIFSEGGEKFYALERNKNVCLSIFDKYEGFGKLKGMQVTGVAAVIEPFSEEYVELAGVRKVPLDVLKKMEHPMNLIRISPKKIEFLNSEFKKEGADSRQVLHL